MIYRLRAELLFANENDLTDALSDLANILPKSTVINPATDRAEASFYEYEFCHHDEDPVRTCELIERWVRALP